jgi:hypothetical protein
MADSRHGKVLDAVRAGVQSLALAAIGPEDVVLRKLPNPRGMRLPCVLVCPAPEREAEFLVTTDRAQLWNYPVVVALCSAFSQDLAVDDADLFRRERVRLYFHGRRLPLSGAPDAVLCRVRAGPILDEAIWERQNVDVSTLTLDVLAEEAGVP